MKACYPQTLLVIEHKTKNICKTARFDLDTGRKWNVSFMPWPLYHRYQLNRRLCGPHSLFWSFLAGLWNLWHVAFTAVPIFFIYFSRQSPVYSEEYVYVYTYLTA